MTQLRDHYFATLKLKSGNASEHRGSREALDRAYNLRSFEIELYWKRGAYFWGFQVAIFAAFGLALKEGVALAPITIALGMLGLFTAIANWLSARGSKFWQSNWEHHIDMLEDDVEGRLHKTVWLTRGNVEFSVSGVNEQLSLLFVAFWLVAFGFALERSGFPAWVIAAAVIAAILGCGVLFRRTNLRASWPNFDGSHGSRFVRPKLFDSDARGPEKFVSRYSPDEPAS